ncbi:MAG TPA: NAD(P)H-binding protein [Streptosporangiaceae bacterium]|nr:NAD(P)H-binding protein [Streptosporangiaceae bacterium]
MIVVTGGTGRVGRQVVTQLRERNLKVRVVSRRPGQPQAGVETAAADLAGPASLEAALRGADALFLLWPFTSAEVTAALAPQLAKVAARHVTRIVYLSAQPAAERPGSFWALTERAIEDSGVAWTFLRPTGFASNTLMWADQIRSGDVVRWPFGAAARSLIDERDIAAVAVRALTDDGHGGARYLLSGPAVLTQAEQLAAIGRALGRDLTWEELPRAEAQQALAAAWGDPGFAASALDTWERFVTHPEVVTSAVRDLTGAPAHSFADWAAANADAFR